MNKLLIGFLLCVCSLSATENVDSEGKGWDDYYQDTLDASVPHYTLKLALQYFQIDGKSSGQAVDLGTGTGRDALFLLKRDWDVLAIDAESLAIDILLSRVDDKQLNQLQVQINPFSGMVLPQNIDLINASLSLPFCAPNDFPECWQKIIDHLAVGGRFCGQLFGDRDEWAYDSSMTFHSQEQMLQLFAERFEIEYLQIEEGLVPSADGKMKHWHLFHVIAKKTK